MKPVTLAMVADFNPANESHVATNQALKHASRALGQEVEPHWIGTEKLTSPAQVAQLDGFGGIWIGPASPYRSMQGALDAIRFARENQIPLLGTCGGFQHIILEYARNVLGYSDAEHEETAGEAPRLFISRLSCSLVGREMTISLKAGSLVGRAYGETEVHEQYRCNFGVNPDFVEVLRSSGLRIVGSDHEGIVRAVELPEHPFFVGTLFLPQHNSTDARPHPLIVAFAEAAAAHQQSLKVSPVDTNGCGNL